METTNLNHLDKFKQAAISAHNWTSFSPERRGEQLINDYNDQLSEDITELKQAGIEQEIIESYKSRYINLFSSWLSAKSRCTSPMITGPANYNIRRHEKANRSEDNHYNIWQEWRKRAKTAIVRKSAPVKTYVSEIDRYKADLESMQKNHILMKEGNKRIKDAKKTGEDLTSYLTETFGIKSHMIEWTLKFGFGLTNNNANIKRVDQRIKDIEAKEALRQSTPDAGYKFEGGEVVFNYEADRIQILFDSRPTKEELTEWKSKGLSSFNWSPSAKAWQRQITPQAIYKTKTIFKAI